MKNADKWFEVWFSEGEDILPHYFLIVTPSPVNHEMVLIIDPQENNKVILQPQTYADAVLWLREDEYIQVKGRVFSDDIN